MRTKTGSFGRVLWVDARNSLLAFLSFCLLVVPGLDLRADADLSPASGPVVLTVAGKIQHTNRGPAVVSGDLEHDLFYGFDIGFPSAAEFDLAMIEGLGMETYEIRYPGLNRTFEFEGPSLHSVLKAVGATGTTVKLVALDGYTSEISMDDIGPHGPVLAFKRDGRHLGIGGFGPAWLVYPSNSPSGDADDAGWAWSVFFIGVD